MKNRNYYLCLPIEVSKRELLSKLYLGMYATLRNYPVIIGDHDGQIFNQITNGFLLYKDHAPWSEKRLSKATSRGLNIGCLDEEGLIYKSPEIYKETRCSQKTLNEADAIFLWGEAQKTAISMPAVKNQFIVGNPRIDLANLLGNRRGKLGSAKKILINTRFPSCNAFRGDQELDALKKLNIIKSKEDLEAHQEFVTHDTIIYKSFLELIDVLSENKELQITIRPPPTENTDVYTCAAKNKSNVSVDQQTELIEQIKNHDIIIHDGCTTAIEAQAAKKIVLGLRPNGVNLKYGEFANEFSMNFSDAESITNFINNFETEQYAKSIDKDIVQHAIFNWGINNKKSADSILSVVDTFRTDPLPNKIKDVINSRESVTNTLHKILNHNKAKTALSFFLGNKFHNYIKRSEARDHKFKKLTKESTQDLLDLLTRLDPHLGNPSDYNLLLISEKSFLLTSTTNKASKPS